jgi:hypothetical protein
LTFNFFGNTTGNSIFKFTLSDALSVDLEINTATINTFSDFGCSTLDSVAGTITSGTIPAGQLEVDIDGTSGVCPQSYQRSGGINITGQGLILHMGTFNAGGTIVTLEYDNSLCQIPLCLS